VHAEHERELERKAEELRRQGELDAIERTIAKWMEEMRAIHLQSEDDKRNLAKATEAISSLKGETELHKRKADEAEARAKRAEEKLLAVGVDLAAARDTIERLREAEKELDARVSLLASDVEERELQLHKVKSHAEKKERNLQEKVDALASVKKDLQR
jgi:chromosome segregation ATPase